MKPENVKILMQDLFDSLPGQSVFGKKISKIPLELSDVSLPVRMMISRLRSWGLLVSESTPGELDQLREDVLKLRASMESYRLRIKELEGLNAAKANCGAKTESCKAKCANKTKSCKAKCSKSKEPEGWVYTP